VVELMELILRKRIDVSSDRNRNSRLSTVNTNLKLRRKSRKSVKKTLMSRNAFRESPVSNQFARRNSRRSFSLIRNLSTIRGMLSKFFFAKRFTSWLVSSKRTNYFRRNVSTKRLKKRRSFKTGSW